MAASSSSPRGVAATATTAATSAPSDSPLFDLPPDKGKFRITADEKGVWRQKVDKTPVGDRESFDWEAYLQRVQENEEIKPIEIIKLREQIKKLYEEKGSPVPPFPGKKIKLGIEGYHCQVMYDMTKDTYQLIFLADSNIPNLDAKKARDHFVPGSRSDDTPAKAFAEVKAADLHSYPNLRDSSHLLVREINRIRVLDRLFKRSNSFSNGSYFGALRSASNNILVMKFDAEHKRDTSFEMITIDDNRPFEKIFNTPVSFLEKCFMFSAVSNIHSALGIKFDDHKVFVQMPPREINEIKKSGMAVFIHSGQLMYGEEKEETLCPFNQNVTDIISAIRNKRLSPPQKQADLIAGVVLILRRNERPDDADALLEAFPREAKLEAKGRIDRSFEKIIKKESVNLEEEPTPDADHPVGPNAQYTLGDLHGNALKLMFFLVRQGVMQLHSGDYDLFVRIYNKSPDDLTKDDLDLFHEILNRAKCNTNIGMLRLIGDDLADRGNNDYFTLCIINKLQEKHVPVTIIMSNHTLNFMKSFEKKEIFCDSIGKGKSQSAANLQRLIDAGLVDRKEINKKVEQYKEDFKPLSYCLSGDKQHIVVYSHAPIDPKAIIWALQRLGIDPLSPMFKSDTPQEEIAKWIDAINESVKGQSFISLFSKEIEEKAVYDDNAYKIDGQREPFLYMMWNRGQLSLKRDIEGMHFVHGHDSTVRAEEKKYVTNLDNNNELGHSESRFSVKGDFVAQYAYGHAKIPAPGLTAALERTHALPPQRAMDYLRSARAFPADFAPPPTPAPTPTGAAAGAGAPAKAAATSTSTSSAAPLSPPAKTAASPPPVSTRVAAGASPPPPPAPAPVNRGAAVVSPSAKVSTSALHPMMGAEVTGMAVAAASSSTSAAVSPVSPAKVVSAAVPSASPAPMASPSVSPPPPAKKSVSFSIPLTLLTSPVRDEKGVYHFTLSRGRDRDADKVIFGMSYSSDNRYTFSLISGNLSAEEKKEIGDISRSMSKEEFEALQQGWNNSHLGKILLGQTNDILGQIAHTKEVKEVKDAKGAKDAKDPGVAVGSTVAAPPSVFTVRPTVSDDQFSAVSAVLSELNGLNESKRGGSLWAIKRKDHAHCEVTKGDGDQRFHIEPRRTYIDEAKSETQETYIVILKANRTMYSDKPLRIEIDSEHQAKWIEAIRIVYGSDPGPRPRISVRPAAPLVSAAPSTGPAAYKPGA